MIKEIAEKYFHEYHQLVGRHIDTWIEKHDFSDTAMDPDFSTTSSAVYSANIEGNTVDLNSYMNQKLAREKFRPDKEIEEIENLIKAYEYAQQTLLSESAFLQCHALFSKTLLIKSKRGRYREDKVGVFDASGLAYMAIEPEYVPEKMGILFNEIGELLASDLSNEKAFYYASMIHLIFVHIHPFMDGNGRGARLLEKWFISQKLGDRFRKLASEHYYKEHRAEYYNNINLGVNYYELNYDGCLPFLCMLPECVR